MGEQEQLKQWAQMQGEVNEQMKKWRVEHPKATLTEIENELDRALAGVRAKMLEDIAIGESSNNWGSKPTEERPTCPQCARALIPRGKHTRRLVTSGGEHIKLVREYGFCSVCQAGLFPPG